MLPPRLSFHLLALLTLGAGLAARAQDVPTPTLNSPFSRFGVGDIVPQAYGAQLGMGRLGIAYNNLHIASPTNPASLGALGFASYQVGVGVQRTRLRSGGVQNVNVDGNLQYLSLAFPLQNTLNDVLDGREGRIRNSMLFSLTPYSRVGYEVQLTDTDPQAGDVINDFRGSGGFYRLQWGNAVKYEDFRFGVNLSYIFGRSNDLTGLLLPDQPGASTLTRTEAFRARGVEVQFGGQYDIVLAALEERPTKVLTLGAAGRLGNTLRGEALQFVTASRATALPTERDTILDATFDESVRLPSDVGIGAYYRDVNHYSVGFDVKRVAWDGYRSTLRPGERLSSSVEVSLGAEYTPDYQAYGKFFPRIVYRVGGYMNQDPRPGVNNDAGLTLGFGIPVVRPREELSYVNISLNAGRLAGDSGISQSYIRFGLGFTLTDNSWFYKRRFN